MSPEEAVQRIATMPAFVRGYILTSFATCHPLYFERYYLEAMSHEV